MKMESLERARTIYEAARARAMADHHEECRRFMADEISVVTSGMDREREYIIAAFAKELEDARH
jgi:hypothetical protein